MEFRELQYFLAVAQEGTISGAAQALHVAQPSLSRQILQRRANESVQLMHKTEHEIINASEDMSRDLLTSHFYFIRLI